MYLIDLFKYLFIDLLSLQSKDNKEPECKIVLVEESAKLPTRGSSAAAGLDLYSSEKCVIKAKGQGCVSTGLRIQCPLDTYGRVAPRSGLAFKYGINVGGGVVDSDYRGIVKVILFNHSEEDFEINIGERIAQIIFEKIVVPHVKNVLSLDDTDRGDAGFGSTGK